MYALLLTSMLSLPVYPLNPVAEDTINAVNAHIAMGYAVGNGVIDGGPELSGRLEVSVGHPIIVRTSGEIRAGKVSSRPWPKGKMVSSTFSTDVLYYRGTNNLTAYFGAGVFYILNAFDADNDVLDSLRSVDGTTAIHFQNSAGLRITVGIRMRTHYSVELAFSRTGTGFIYDERLGANSYSFTRQDVSVNDARFSLGYLIPIRRR